MNTGFVIEDKYNQQVGLVNIEESIKLIRHYEFMHSQSLYYTIDVYENGLIKVYRITYVGMGGGGNCYYRDDNTYKPQEEFIINITNGEKLNDIYLELIDNIYSPLCEKKCKKQHYKDLSCLCNTIDCCGRPVKYCCAFSTISSNIWEPINSASRPLDPKELLLKHTFETLLIIKKLYEKIVIF